MKIRIIKINKPVLLLALILAVREVHAADPLRIPFPDTASPPGSEWSWVGRNLIVDGLPMSMKTFTYVGTEADLIAHFENEWRTIGHGAIRRNQIGPNSVLSYELPDYFITVQYQQSGDKIEGSITASLPLTQKGKPLKAMLAKPPGSKVVSQIDSNDQGAISQSVTLMSRREARFNAAYYENQLSHQGWIPVSQQCSSSGCDSRYHSERGLLQISIKELPAGHGNGSRILIHLMKQ